MASARCLIGRQGWLGVFFRGVWQNGQGVSSTMTGVSSTMTATSHSQCRLLSQDSGDGAQPQAFDEKLLEHLVCPLSKKDLRYDKERDELVCDEIGVAYPIVNGIPNLVPQDARMLKQTSSDSTQD